MKFKRKILVYGYGNPGRQDDGLGYEMIRRLEKRLVEQGIREVTLDANYQLNIEDAELISGYDLVIWVDASSEDIEGYCLTEVREQKEVSFTTHSASPGYILKLCRDLFDTYPQAFLLHIKGYQWDFKEGLSEMAVKNLEKALTFVMDIIMKFLISDHGKSEVMAKPS